MLPSVQIPAGISTQNCLAWSPDGELALAAGEEVHLLLPRHNDAEPWTHVRFHVNNFTVNEWPWQLPASFKDMSIGEEQAPVTITALAWSPCGLAKHRRSALAVLTSNLLLSLWTSYSDPKDPESWERVMIVNYFLAPENISTPHRESRISQRIRSMAWAPVCPEHAEQQVPFLMRKWGIFLMAIADDENGVYFVNFSSPFISTTMTWGIQTLLYKRNQPTAKPSHRPSLLRLAMSEKYFIDRISFDTWKSKERIPVTYHSSGTIHRDTLVLDLGPSLSAIVEPVIGTIDQSQKGSVRHVQMTNYASASLPTFTPSIKSQIQKQRETYGAESRLGLHVLSRIWGFASFGSLSAVCITLHPSQSIEYTIAANNLAIVLFDSVDPEQQKFPWQGPTTVNENRARHTILGTILNGTILKTLDLSSLDLKIMYNAMCASVLMEDLQQPQRFQSLSEILNILGKKTGIDLKPERTMLKSTHTIPQDSRQQVLGLVRKTTELRGQASSHSGTSTIQLLDYCLICQETEGLKPICFESLTEAYCPQMHPFGNSSSYRFEVAHLG